MKKLSWAVTAGDQDPDSEDDQPCGDHFIDKDLECHDGDAHRPTPGKNPYWQGERKGPEDKSKTPERKGGEKNQPGHARDRSEHTIQNRERLELLLDEGHTPESLGRDNVNHFADMWEDANGRPIDDQGIHDLSEMVNQKMGESFSQDPSQKGIHDPSAPKGFKGPKGRQLWKQEKAPFSRETEMPREGGGMEHTPDSSGGGEFGGGLYDHYKNVLKDRSSGGGDAPKKSNVPEGGDGGPWIDNGAAKTKKEEEPSQDEQKAESALAYQLTWGKIVQDRVDDDLERKRHSRCSDDVAEGRPCGDGEDPKKGKCNPDIQAPTAPAAPAAPPGGGGKPPGRSEGPAGKADKGYRMSDKLKGPAQEGIGLQPGQDAGREARMAQHVDFLSQDNGMDTKQTTNLMHNMLGGDITSNPDGTNSVGSRAATPQEAKQQNDDFKDTLTKTGWEPHSEMGSKSVWKKGNTAVILEKKNNGNQMKIKNLRPAAPPKQRGRR
ncbi:hypothetical protein LCGC14_0671200 [marine sediment metagenome]|uniref:Uncharacterized protein n=1 Tax=marine sediment metagenome TaxID=412755 RepID=A0A0F9QQW5_9ZZZZ